MVIDNFYAQDNKNLGDNVAPQSEFASNCYGNSVIASIIDDYLHYSKETSWVKSKFIYDIIDSLVYKYKSATAISMRSLFRPYNSLINNYISFSMRTVSESLESLLEKLESAYNEFEESYQSFDKLGTDNDFEVKIRNCVLAYYNLVHNSVFFKDNNNLSVVQFRNSEFLNNLVLPNYKELYINNLKPELGFFVPFTDAYCLQALIDIADEVWKYKNSYDFDNPLDEMRIAALCSRAEAKFGRYFYLNGESYQVSLNRKSSIIVARPLYNKSSVTAVKPIRLFEKIKVFIANDCNNDDDCCVNDLSPKIYKIAIIGHCENCSDLKQNAEVNDLCSSLCGWIDEQLNNMERPQRICIELTYFVNVIDHYDFKGKDIIQPERLQEGTKWESNKDGNSVNVSCKVEFCNYEMDFTFSNDKIKEIIEKHHMVFLIEPPFLFYEDFEIRSEVPINYYCSELDNLSNQSNGIELVWESKDDSDSENNKQIVYQSLRYLSAQLNRIMASRSMEAGEICRVINENYLNVIQTAAKDVTTRDLIKHRVVYFFTSETTILKFGQTASYPISRVERYSGKKMIIMQFSNCKTNSLLEKYMPSQVSDVAAEFCIPVWSILKYEAIRYTFKRKNIIKVSSKLTNDLTEYDYLRILKSIIVDVSAKPENEGSFNIILNIRIKDCLYGYLLNRFKNISEEDINTLNNNLLDWTYNYLDLLFNKIIFNAEALNPIEKLIKEGFSINLYSSAESAEGMFFLFLYDEWKNNRQLTHKFANRLTINKQDSSPIDASKSILSQKNLSKSNQDNFFMDKKLFIDIPKRIAKWGDLGAIATNLCIEAGSRKYYNGDKNYFSDMANALIGLCKWAKLENSVLFENITSWKKSLQ